MTNGPDRGGLPPAPPLPDQRNGGGQADDPLVPEDFSAWMAKIVDAFGRSWRLVALLQFSLNLPLAIVLVLFQHAAGSRITVGSDASLHFRHPGAAAGLGVLLVVLALVLGALVQLGSLWVIVRQADGGTVGLGPALRFALSRALPMIGWEVLAALMIGVGFVLVLPGIYLAVVLIPTLLGVVGLERRGLRRCFELANRSFLALFGRCCAALLIALAYTRIVQVVINAIFGSSADGYGPQLASGLLQLPLDVAGIAFLVVTYAELRGRNVRTTTRELATDLDN